MNIHNPQLADSVLKALVDRKANSPEKIAAYLNADPNEVYLITEELRTNLRWFDHSKSAYGREDSYILLVNSEAAIRAFLAQGGFTEQYNRQNKKEQEEVEFRALQIKNLEAVTRQAEQAINDSAHAKGIARLSLLFAFLAIAVSIVLHYL